MEEMIEDTKGEGKEEKRREGTTVFVVHRRRYHKQDVFRGRKLKIRSTVERLGQPNPCVCLLQSRTSRSPKEAKIRHGVGVIIASIALLCWCCSPDDSSERRDYGETRTV